MTRKTALVVWLAGLLAGVACSTSSGSNGEIAEAVGDTGDLGVAPDVVDSGDNGEEIVPDVSAGADLPEPDEAGEGGATETETGDADVALPPAGCDFESPDHTVGVRVCKPGASNGYLLYPVKHLPDVFLIDPLGRVVNHWAKSKYEPGQSCYLRPNGNLVRTAMPKGNFSIGGGEGGRLEEYDWDDNLVWAFDFASPTGMTHHDFTILPNGNLLMLAVEKKEKEAAAAVGFDPAKLKEGYVAPEMVIEVKMTGSATYEIVWEWHVWDHLVQKANASLANYGDPKQHPELLEVTGSPPAFWNHANSIKYSAELDQIIISARSHNEFWVIDHTTTTEEAASHQGGKQVKGGDLLYRWGNPANYGGGTKDDMMLFQQHDAQWIESGCPGAGDILVFNNGLSRPDGAYSTIDQLTPPVAEDGSYPVPALGQPWGPSELSWQYKAEPPTSFYSAEISGAQRLPDGNTLVCEGLTGRLFEVTPEGQIVWEFVNPVANNGPMSQYELAPLDVKSHPENAVFKGHWYPPDFAGFAGRDLTPGDVIEDDDTTCPAADNVNYTCAAVCPTGSEDVADHFTCAEAGKTCCFKLVQGEQPPPKP